MSFRVVPGKKAFKFISALSQKKCYVVSKEDGSCTEKEQEFPLQGHEKPVFGILGTYCLRKGKYLVVVTQHRYIDSLVGSKIYQVGKVDVIPYTRVYDEDRTYLGMIRDLLTYDNFFYYSDMFGKYEMSGTFRAQEQRNFQYRPTSEFVWNWNALPKSVQEARSAHPLYINLIQGSVHKFSMKRFSYFLVSRRARIMAGTRYNRRGVDLEGNAANYVETEQIIVGEEKNDVYSHVILRGSIPVIWTQKVDLNYNPKIDTSKSLSEISTESFKLHYSHLLKKFQGNMILNIDLTKEKGSELPLKEAFKKQVIGLENAMVKYYSFDIHKICGQTRFHKMDILKKEFERQMVDEDAVLFSSSEMSQNRLLRVNCKDSLDRTNMVQTFFGKQIVELILKKMGIFSENETLSNFVEIHKKIITCWSDNGDTLSRLYSGSGALKTDVTRKINGKQTILGLIADGKKSVFRYYQNNLADGYKQDCIDLVANNVENLEKIEKKIRPTLAWLLWIAFAMFKPNTTPKRRKWFIGMFLCLVWLIWFIIFWKLLFMDGRHLIDEPTLLKNEYVRKKKKKKE